MVSENQREEITVSDGLQLGRSTVDTTDIKTAEDEVNTLQKQVNEVNCPLSLPSPSFSLSFFFFFFTFFFFYFFSLSQTINCMLIPIMTICIPAEEC